MEAAIAARMLKASGIDDDDEEEQAAAAEEDSALEYGFAMRHGGATHSQPSALSDEAAKKELDAFLDGDDDEDDEDEYEEVYEAAAFRASMRKEKLLAIAEEQDEDANAQPPAASKAMLTTAVAAAPIAAAAAAGSTSTTLPIPDDATSYELGPGALGLVLDDDEAFGGVVITEVKSYGIGAAVGVVPRSVVVGVNGESVIGLTRDELIDVIQDIERPLTMQLLLPDESDGSDGESDGSDGEREEASPAASSSHDADATALAAIEFEERRAQERIAELEKRLKSTEAAARAAAASSDPRAAAGPPARAQPVHSPEASAAAVTLLQATMRRRLATAERDARAALQRAQDETADRVDAATLVQAAARRRAAKSELDTRAAQIRVTNGAAALQKAVRRKVAVAEEHALAEAREEERRAAIVVEAQQRREAKAKAAVEAKVKAAAEEAARAEEKARAKAEAEAKAQAEAAAKAKAAAEVQAAAEAARATRAATTVQNKVRRRMAVAEHDNRSRQRQASVAATAVQSVVRRKIAEAHHDTLAQQRQADLEREKAALLQREAALDAERARLAAHARRRHEAAQVEVQRRRAATAATAVQAAVRRKIAVAQHDGLVQQRRTTSAATRVQAAARRRAAQVGAAEAKRTEGRPPSAQRPSTQPPHPMTTNPAPTLAPPPVAAGRARPGPPPRQHDAAATRLQAVHRGSIGQRNVIEAPQTASSPSPPLVPMLPTPGRPHTSVQPPVTAPALEGAVTGSSSPSTAPSLAPAAVPSLAPAAATYFYERVTSVRGGLMPSAAEATWEMNAPSTAPHEPTKALLPPSPFAAYPYGGEMPPPPWPHLEYDHEVQHENAGLRKEAAAARDQLRALEMEQQQQQQQQPPPPSPPSSLMCSSSLAGPTHSSSPPLASTTIAGSGHPIVDGLLRCVRACHACLETYAYDGSPPQPHGSPPQPHGSPPHPYASSSSSRLGYPRRLGSNHLASVPVHAARRSLSSRASPAVRSLSPRASAAARYQLPSPRRRPFAPPQADATAGKGGDDDDTDALVINLDAARRAADAVTPEFDFGAASRALERSHARAEADLARAFDAVEMDLAVLRSPMSVGEHRFTPRTQLPPSDARPRAALQSREAAPSPQMAAQLLREREARFRAARGDDWATRTCVLNLESAQPGRRRWDA